MRKLARSTVFYIILAVLALVLVSALFRGGSDREKLSLSTFERKTAAGQVRTAEVSDRDLLFALREGDEAAQILVQVKSWYATDCTGGSRSKRSAWMPSTS